MEGSESANLSVQTRSRRHKILRERAVRAEKRVERRGDERPKVDPQATPFVQQREAGLPRGRAR